MATNGDELQRELASELIQTLVSSGLISNREERSVHFMVMNVGQSRTSCDL